MARQNFTGLVISTGKMNKTIKVRVSHVKFNRLISKDVVQYKDFMVHDELNKCVEGDIVRIQYVRPLSAKKRFAVSEIMMNKGTEWLKYQEDAPAKVASEELGLLEQYENDRKQRIENQGKSPLVEELRQLSKAFKSAEVSDEHAKNVELLKEKYGITSWPPTTEVVKLDVSALKEDLAKLQIAIEKNEVGSRVDELLSADPVKADEILSSLGKNIEGMKKSIKRNILLKHFAKALA